MIPLRDNAPRFSAPFVTLALIGINILVFVYQLTLDPFSLNQFVFQNGVVPLRFARFVAGSVPAEAAVPPLLLSMFMHGGFLHLISNMWFLWIFGDNLEDQLGHFRYLGFYLACGLVASFAHIFLNVRSTLPSVGASGAIAGVMGGYLILFPGARVLTLVPFFLIFTVEIPAFVILLYWIVMQLFSGFATLTATTAQSQGGVAWWAHIGGFFAGLGLVKAMGRRRYLRRYYEW
jgi:membrane associated rhomboid family serine protease